MPFLMIVIFIHTHKSLSCSYKEVYTSSGWTTRGSTNVIGIPFHIEQVYLNRHKDITSSSHSHIISSELKCHNIVEYPNKNEHKQIMTPFIGVQSPHKLPIYFTASIFANHFLHQSISFTAPLSDIILDLFHSLI